jgi:hypothetical protein
MIDFLIAAAVVVPVVLGATWWLFSRSHRADERRVMALASRLNCPTCGVSDFVWTAQWAVNEPDMEEEVGEFHFTDDGKGFHHPSSDDSPEG